MAASVITITHKNHGRVRWINAAITASSVDGTVTATAIPAFDGYLYALHTNPGATAPTADYDITLVDGDGLDRLQGVGADRHTSSSQQVPIVYTSTTRTPPVSSDETLTLTIANNSVNSAIFAIRIYYQPA